jgi:hypothetical protein
MAALLAGSVISGFSTWSDIERETNDMVRCTNAQPIDRRRLLQVLHSTRVLDSTLAGALRFLQAPSGGKSLGSYLHGLKDKQVISDQERESFQKQIVDPRNTCMHQAGAYPKSDHEVNILLSAMDSCLATVVAALQPAVVTVGVSAGNP